VGAGQARNPVPSDRLALVQQIVVKLAIAIHLAPVLPCLPDQLGLARVFPGPLAQRAPQSGIEAAGMDAQTTTHHTHREQRTMLGHERVSHFASRANYAAEITSAHVSLLASKFGKKASTNLGAVRIAQNHLPPLGVDGDFERYYSSKGTLIKDIVHFLKSVAEMILKFYGVEVFKTFLRRTILGRHSE